MSFINPEYFWLFVFLFAAFAKRDLKEIRFIQIAYIISFIFIVLALARPVVEREPIKTDELLSDVVLGVDLSYSMQAEDVTPTRLDAAKLAL